MIDEEQRIRLWEMVRDLHAKKEYRPVAVAIICDPSRNILLVQSAKNPDEWLCPQGGIEAGESPDEALFREIKEEIGIDRAILDIVQFLGIEELNAETSRSDMRGFSKGKRYFFFSLCYYGAGNLSIDRNEISSYIWTPRQAVPNILATTRPEKKRLILRWLNRI